MSKQYYCYILESVRTQRTYVGFTVNPERRLRQHNKEIAGGAKYTSRGGPWRMICYITGFKTKRMALQCEWAIKHCNYVNKKIKITTKRPNRNTNNRIAKLFSVIMRERLCKTSESNSEQNYTIKWLVDGYQELAGLVPYVRCQEYVAMTNGDKSETDVKSRV